ncbi:hypothetical protein CYY_007647 [Polysphondylium violaceum]|uniref:Nudix hydrolase domain-containing protein n=1 Tax=Polysphondylium violaceum TaxID=133409 RepID=A0A8J4UQR4_9MYCE|nr:hypothetical protein CYY_007647 [Polysphondylium violaceum]
MSIIIESIDKSINQTLENKFNFTTTSTTSEKHHNFKHYFHSNNREDTNNILKNYNQDVPITCLVLNIEYKHKSKTDIELLEATDLLIQECRLKRKLYSFIIVFIKEEASNAAYCATAMNKLIPHGANMVTQSVDVLINALQIISTTSILESGSYSCPICTEGGIATNLSQDHLREHVFLFHCAMPLHEIHEKMPTCPICKEAPREPIGVHLHERHGPQGEKTEKEQSLSTIYPFCLVICKRKDGSFLLVNEAAGRGWWLPGGRTNIGESLQQCAIRETKEESGIDVAIKGILRIEYSPHMGYSRMRVIFYAEPVDDKQLPKSLPCYESVCAAYVKVSELTNFYLRGKEPNIWFNYVNQGKTIHPVSLLTLENALPR